MPAAVLIGGLIAIAFAFAAIAATLLIRNLVVQPLRSASVAVSETALVGGVLAWMLSALANLIEVSLAGVQTLVGQAEQQAADWWRYLVNNTVWDWLSNEITAVHYLQSVWSTLVFTINSFSPLWTYVTSAVAPTVWAIRADLAGLHQWIDGYELPFIRGVASDLSALHQWIDGYELPLIRGIGADLSNLRQWINANLVTRSQLSGAQAATLAAAAAIVAPVAAAVTSIEESPCMKTCGPLGDLGQLLQGLEDAGLLVILIGLMEEARTNPGQVASMIDATVGAAGRDVLKSLQLGILD